jgi:general secretion pathway protein D
MKKRIAYGLLAGLLLPALIAHAQDLPPAAQRPAPADQPLAAPPVKRPAVVEDQRPAAPAPKPKDEKLYSQSFMDASLEQIIDFYNEWTGRTLIIQTDLSPTITLKFSKLTKDEAMQAIETVLAQNGVAFVPMGEKFLKVVPIATARQEGMAIEPFDAERVYTAADQLMSQIIPLRYVVFADVSEIIQHLVHGYAKIQNLERINSVLVTDTSANIARILEAIALVDQPLEKIEPRIYQLNDAKAEDIAGKLKELVEAASTSTSKQQQQTVAAARTIPGVIRAPQTGTTSVSSALTGSGADETQMIQGEVKFVSDDRTNILIVFSKAANFDFFDNIIKVLDVAVDPEVVVETVNLEYAEAEEISSVLNDFIGAAQADEETKGTATDGAATGENRSVQDMIAQRAAPKRQSGETTKSAIGRLSADTKILSDERTNSLLLMGSKSDIEILKKIIATLDIMLQQVMIEAVILNVTVGDDFATGIDWVYEKGAALSKSRTFGSSLGSTITTNLLSTAVGSPTFSYFQSIPKLDMQLLIQAAKSDSDARILSTPIVLTTDNTEAKITVADEKPVITSSSASSTYSTSSYQYKTIGVELTVTPHISPQNFVLMEISQSADELGDDVTIDENTVPTILKREISATIGVKDRETVILGGLVRKANNQNSTKIPLLGDIPLLGRLFSYRSNSDEQQELVVLLTPYVLNTPAEAQAETIRRYNASDSSDTKWPRGWSLSELANDEAEKDAWKNKKKAESEEEAEVEKAATGETVKETAEEMTGE